MTSIDAWNALQKWLVMNVGSKEADECLELVGAIVSAELAPYLGKTR